MAADTRARAERAMRELLESYFAERGGRAPRATTQIKVARVEQAAGTTRVVLVDSGALLGQRTSAAMAAAARANFCAPHPADARLTRRVSLPCTTPFVISRDDATRPREVPKSAVAWSLIAAVVAPRRAHAAEAMPRASISILKPLARTLRVGHGIHGDLGAKSGPAILAMDSSAV